MIKIFIYFLFILSSTPVFAQSLTSNKIVMTATSGTSSSSPIEQDSDITDNLGVSIIVANNVTMSVPGGITAPITGNVTGNLTGNVTGNVTGSSGSTTGNAATVTNGLYTNNIGSTVQAYNPNLTAINQSLTTTSSPNFTSVTANLIGNVTGNASTASGGWFTSQNVVTGSRTIGSYYKNTTGKPMLVTIEYYAPAGGGISIFTDSNSTPTTQVGGGNSTSYTTSTFIVIPNNYYGMTQSGGSGGIGYWTEWY